MYYKDDDYDYYPDVEDEIEEYDPADYYYEEKYELNYGSDSYDDCGDDYISSRGSGWTQADWNEYYTGDPEIECDPGDYWDD